MKSIDQQLFDWLYVTAYDLGYEVYDFLPSLDVEYPFVVLGEVHVIPQQYKHKTLGTMHAVVDIWAEASSRIEISNMSEKLMEKFSGWQQLDSRSVKMNISSSTKRVLSDTSTEKPLWHAILDLEFRIH